MSNANKRVKTHYRGTLEDGSPFDSSYDRGEPLEFVCMSGQMIPGFDKAVESMEVGEKKTVRLEPEEAYGPVNEAAFQVVPRSALQGEGDLHVDQQVVLQGPDGQPFPVRVAKVTDSEITFDMNHPLAGKPLIFEIELVDVED